MNTLQLGTRVRYKRTLTRKTSYGDGVKKLEHYRQWVPTSEWELQCFGMSAKLWPEYFGEGIITGKRTLANGNISYYDHGSNFVMKEHFEAYIVTFDLRRKPVYVLPEDLEVIQPITFNHVGKPLTKQEKEDLRKWFHSKQEA